MLGNLPQIMVLAVNTYNDSTEHLATCARVGILGPTQGPVGVTFSCCVLLWEGWGAAVCRAVCRHRETALPGLRSQQSQQTKEKVYKGGRNKSCTMGAPRVGPRSGNRNANRIQKSRLSVEEGCPYVKNEHISCVLDLGSHTHKTPFLWAPLTHPLRSIRSTVLYMIVHSVLKHMGIYMLTICEVLGKQR